MNPNNDRHIQLSIQCRNLKKMDTFSQSDPYVVVFVKDSDNRTYEKIGKT